MTTLHSSVTDPDIHEPKGASTAQAGQVLVSNGSGGTYWRNPIGLTNVYVVGTVADLPPPVSGIILLLDNSVYRFSGEVDIGSNRIILGQGTVIEGANPSSDIITSTTTLALISGQEARIQNITLRAPSGKVLDIAGTMTDICVLDGVRIDSCSTVGSFGGCALYRFASFTVSQASSSGLDFTGSNGALRITDSQFRNFAGIGIDLRGAVFEGINISASSFDNTVGTYSISKDVGSANITATGGAVLSGSLFQGFDPFVENYSGSENYWTVVSNANLSNTVIGASGYIIGSTFDTEFTDTTSRVPVLFDGGFVTETDNQFSVDTEGQMTYEGNNSALVDMQASVFANVSGGADRNYRYFFAKNGVVLEGSVAQNLYDGSNSGACAVQGVTTVVNGDVISLTVQAVDQTTKLNVETVSIKILGV